MVCFVILAAAASITVVKTLRIYWLVTTLRRKSQCLLNIKRGMTVYQ